MAKSGFVNEEGAAIDIDGHGDNDFLFHEGTPVWDSDISELVFEAGNGIGASLGVIDGFESGDLSAYTGDTGQFSVSTAVVKDGTYAMVTSSDDRNIYSMSGLQNYPEQGDKFEFYTYNTAPGTHGAGVYFGLQAPSDSDTYDISVGRNGTGSLADVGFRIHKRQNGGQTILDSDTGTDVPADEWVRGVVDWQSTMTITFYNAAGDQLTQLSATDSTFTSGGWGWTSRHTGGGGGVGNVYHDLAQII